MKKNLLIALTVCGVILAPKQTLATGSDFFAPAGFEAAWVAQTQAGTSDQYFEVDACEVVEFEAQFRNTGTQPWENAGENLVAFNIYKDPAVTSYPDTFSYEIGRRESYFEHSSWLTPYRIDALQESSIAPGEIGTIKMQFQIPCTAVPGRYREDISMAVGSRWMPNPTNGDPLNVAHIWVGFTIMGKQPDMDTQTFTVTYHDDMVKEYYADVYTLTTPQQGWQQVAESPYGTTLQHAGEGIILEKNGYALIIDPAVEVGGMTCTFSEDAAGEDEMFGMLMTDYVSIYATDGVQFRRSRSGREINSLEYIYRIFNVCEINPATPEFGSQPTTFGFISYEGPTYPQTDAATRLDELDAILASITEE